MSPAPRSGLLSATVHGLRDALRWRLILLWLLLLAVPTLLVTVPQWLILAPKLSYSVHAETWASQIQVPVIADLVMQIMRDNRSPVIAFGAAMVLLLTLLLSPLMTGMALTQLRQSDPLGFRRLAQGGIAEYGRLLRLLLLAAIPMGIALGLAAAAKHIAGNVADSAIFAADAELASNLAKIGGGLMLLLAHASVEAGRAHLLADHRLRSAFKAGWRGFKLLLRRPCLR